MKNTVSYLLKANIPGTCAKCGTDIFIGDDVYIVTGPFMSTTYHADCLKVGDVIL